MCGRYFLTSTRPSIVDEFNIGVVADLDHVKINGRYNIAPTQPVAVLVPTTDKQRMLTAMRWGIIPQWITTDPAEAGSLQGLLALAMEGTIYKTAVSTRVNRVKNDDPAIWRKEK